MKVWELMRDLEKAPAGADILVKTNRNVGKEIEDTSYYDPSVTPTAFEWPFHSFIIHLK